MYVKLKVNFDKIKKALNLEALEDHFLDDNHKDYYLEELLVSKHECFKCDTVTEVSVDDLSKQIIDLCEGDEYPDVVAEFVHVDDVVEEGEQEYTQGVILKVAKSIAVIVEGSNTIVFKGRRQSITADNNLVGELFHLLSENLDFDADVEVVEFSSDRPDAPWHTRECLIPAKETMMIEIVNHKLNLIEESMEFMPTHEVDLPISTILMMVKSPTLYVQKDRVNPFEELSWEDQLKLFDNIKQEDIEALYK